MQTRVYFLFLTCLLELLIKNCTFVRGEHSYKVLLIVS